VQPAPAPAGETQPDPADAQPAGSGIFQSIQDLLARLWAWLSGAQPAPAASAPLIQAAQIPAAGQMTISYEYDPLNRLTAADYSDGSYFHYSYDPVGNRLEETLPGGTNTYTYDQANRLTAVNGLAYTWDANGNLIADAVYTYAYNQANRLVSVASGGVEVVSYVYNGLGDRLVETTNGETTYFTMDLNRGLTQALADGEYTYLYGNGRIARTNQSGAGYYLADALGSVRLVVDAAGEVVLAQRYAPYGTVLSSAGGGGSGYGVTGEWGAAESGLTYLRARWYAPETGRFIQQDPFSGIPLGPQSFNGYSYAVNNPVRYLDASGKCPPCWLLITLGLYMLGTSGCTDTPNPTPGATPTMPPTTPPTINPSSAPSPSSTPNPSPTSSGTSLGEFLITHYIMPIEDDPFFQGCDNCYSANIPIWENGQVVYHPHNNAFVYGVSAPGTISDFNWGVYQEGTGITADGRYLSIDFEHRTEDNRTPRSRTLQFPGCQIANI